MSGFRLRDYTPKSLYARLATLVALPVIAIFAFFSLYYYQEHIRDVNEKLSLEFDYHDSSAEYEPDSRFGDTSLVAMSSFTRDFTAGYFGKDLPILEVGLSQPLSPDDMIVTGSVFANNFGEMEIDARW